MRSAFVDLVVVGIFARVQISLRSATLRDFLWEVQPRRRVEGWETYSFASIGTLVGERVVVHVTRGWHGSNDCRMVGLGQVQAVTVNGPIMEDGINQLFHPAYPLPPQHQPFPDSHEVVQDQFHRMFSLSSYPSLTIPIQQPLTSTAFTIALHPQQVTTLLLLLPPPLRLATNPSRHSPKIPHPLPIHPSLSHLSMMNLFM
jgi:hypothetical protein